MRRLLARSFPIRAGSAGALRAVPLGAARGSRPDAARRAEGARDHDRAGAGVLPPAARYRGSRHGGDQGGAARARDPAGGLRAAGAAADDQRCDHPACWRGAASTWWWRRGRAAAARSCTISAARRKRSRQARRNVDAWMKELGKGPVDAIIVNASGCGTMVKDYGHLLKDDPAYAERAKQIADLARRQRVRRRVRARRAGALVVAARRLSLGVFAAAWPGHPDEPRALLRQAGFACRRARGAHLLRVGRHLQHSAAGDRGQVARSQGQATSRRSRPDVVAAGNIGCITQLAGGIDIPVVHTVELLDWAYGGPVPRGLDALEPLRHRCAEAEARRRFHRRVTLSIMARLPETPLVSLRQSSPEFAAGRPERTTELKGTLESQVLLV